MDQYFPKFPPETFSLGTAHNMIFNNLRQRNEGLDVEIQITDNETVTSFKVHKLVLLMYAPEFFNTALSDRWNTEKEPEVNDKQEVVNKNSSLKAVPEVATPLRVLKMGIEHTNPAIFKEILDFMYTGSITFRPANIQALLTTAHYLQLTTLHQHAQVYLKRMLNAKPEVGKHQKYEHLAINEESKLCRFEKKLYIFEKPTVGMMIIVKSVPDNRWMFADSLEFVQIENPLDDSDVYLCDHNYIILHQTPTRRLNSLPVTVGILYYSGAIEKNVYICGSGPLGSHCFNLDTRKFTDFPLPARGINSFVNCFWPAPFTWQYMRKIFVLDDEYLNVFELSSDEPKWQEYRIPECYYLPHNPFLKIEVLRGALRFYDSTGLNKNFYFEPYNKTFDRFNG